MIPKTKEITETILTSDGIAMLGDVKISDDDDYDCYSYYSNSLNNLPNGLELFCKYLTDKKKMIYNGKTYQIHYLEHSYNDRYKISSDTEILLVVTGGDRWNDFRNTASIVDDFMDNFTMFSTYDIEYTKKLK